MDIEIKPYQITDHKIFTTETLYNGRKVTLTIRTESDPTNCKLSYIHGIGELWGYTQDKGFYIGLIRSLCRKNLKGSVIINTTNKHIADIINEGFDTYYYHKVPIGYSNGYQYHICIRNDVNPNNNCRKPEANTNLNVKVDGLKKEDINYDQLASKLRVELKSRRRKTDFVDKFIEDLKK